VHKLKLLVPPACFEALLKNI